MATPTELTTKRSRAAAMIRVMGSRSIRHAVMAAVVGSSLVGPIAAASADEVEPVHFTYDAPARCPSESEFLDMIARDGGRFLSVSEALPVRSFQLHIEGNEPTKGVLIVRDPAGSEAVQEMTGAGCEEVVRSLAVLVSLSLEPPASISPERARSEPPPPAVADAARPQPAVPGLAASALSVESHDTISSDGESLALVPGPHGWRIDVSGEGTVSTGAEPSLVGGFAAYVELADEVPSFVAPSFRLGAEISANQGRGFTSIRRFVGRVDACTFRALATRPWSDDAFTLEPCARIDVGRIEAAAFDGLASVDAARLWIAPAGLLRFRWTSPGVFFEVEGGITFPLVREHFSGSVDNFTVPAAGATSGLGFGVYLGSGAVGAGKSRERGAI